MTLSCLQDIWNEVHKLGFKYLNLRQLNQDSLENLFGAIRQHNPTDRNPTCASFVTALRTSIISGITSSNSRNSNCQRDANKLLTDLNHYIDLQKDELEEINEAEENDTLNQDLTCFELSNLNIPDFPECDDERIENNLINIEGQPTVYLAGYLAYTLKSRPCAKCQSCLQTHDIESQMYSYIKLRE